MALDPSSCSPILLRSHEILLYLLKRSTFVSVGELSRNLGFPRSTTLRILHTLHVQGYLVKDAVKPCFAPGKKILEMAALQLKNQDILSLAKPLIDALAEEVGETVKLNRLKDDQAQIMYCCLGKKSMHVAVSPGISFPWHTGAAGKILVAFSSVNKQKELLSKNLKSFTRKTITNREALRKHLEKIRSEVIAYDEGEFLDEVRGISTPVFDYSKEVHYAISIPYLNNPIIENHVLSCIEKLKRVSRELGRLQGAL